MIIPLLFQPEKARKIEEGLGRLVQTKLTMERTRKDQLEDTYMGQMPMIAAMLAEDNDDVDEMAARAMDLIQACLNIAVEFYK